MGKGKTALVELQISLDLDWSKMSIHFYVGAGCRASVLGGVDKNRILEF